MSAVAHDLQPSHIESETQVGGAGLHLLTTDHVRRDTKVANVGGHLLPVIHPYSEDHPLPDDGDLSAADDGCFETHTASVGGTISSTSPKDGSQTTTQTAAWVELRICADLLWRAQEERKAVSNMLRHTDADMFGHILANVEATEHAAKLMLRRCYRRTVPDSLKALEKANRGLGIDILARILGRLGDPYIATPHWWEGTGSNRVLMQGEPYVRTIGQLWQYCGHGAPARKAKGMSAEDLMGLGSPDLKMLVHIAAECAMKAGKPGDRYRDAYDTAREAVAEKVHTAKCPQCVGSSNEGDPWRPGHQHAHALRMVGKEILRDLWLARHEEEEL